MEQKRPTILIVDDEKSNLDVLVNLLNGDYRTVVAKNGEQALRRLNPFVDEIDLILLDILMPDMDGYEVCRRIKKNIDTRSIPVIFITALSDTEDETTGFELGAVDYITKPFKPPVVRARVKTHIELKLSRDLCELMAKEDKLTGIPNRRRFEEFYEFQWNGIMRRKIPLSLILMDIDYFKRYNDNYGHGAGDDCLRLVASALKSAVPRTLDLVARYGGEEFVCVLPDTDSDGGTRVAERLLDAVRELKIPHEFSDATNHITMSMGVSTAVPPVTMNAKTLIETADMALYEAKARGRNQVRFLSVGNMV